MGINVLIPSATPADPRRQLSVAKTTPAQSDRVILSIQTTNPHDTGQNSIVVLASDLQMALKALGGNMFYNGDDD